MKPNVIAAGVLTDADRLKVQLCQSVRSPGLNPQNMFLLLTTLLEQEFNEGIDASTAERFAEFVKGKHPNGMGLEPRQLLKIVSDLKHPHEVAPHRDKALKARMEWMRERVRQLVDAAEPPQPERQIGIPGGKAGPGRGKKTEHGVPRFHGNHAAALVSRLKRDRPDVAARLAAGEFRSARAAAIEAGIVSAAPRVPLTDPKAVTRKLIAQGDDFASEVMEGLRAYFSAKERE